MDDYDYSDEIYDFSHYVGSKHVQVAGGTLSGDSEEFAVYFERYDVYSIYDDGGVNTYTKKEYTYSKYGFMSTDTKEKIIPAKYDEVRCFSGGFAAVCKKSKLAHEQKEKWGFVNTEGKEIIPCIFDDVTDFKEAKAGIMINDKWAIIKENGTLLVDFELDAFEGFENKSAIAAKDGKWGIIVQTGYFCYAGPTYDRIHRDAANRVIHVMKSRKWGLLSDDYNDDYKMIVNTEYDEIIGGGNGFKVRQSRLWGFVDYSGKIIIDIKYDKIEILEGGFFIRADNKWGYLDESGKTIIDPIFEHIDMEQGDFVVSDKNGFGIMSAEGKVILDCSYDQIGKLKDGVRDVRKNMLWGLVAKDGDVLIPVVYKSVWIPKYRALREEAVLELKKNYE